MDATTTICHRYTPPEQLAMFTKTADIIVSAAGIIYYNNLKYFYFYNKLYYIDHQEFQI